MIGTITYCRNNRIRITCKNGEMIGTSYTILDCPFPKNAIVRFEIIDSDKKKAIDIQLVDDSSTTFKPIESETSKIIEKNDKRVEEKFTDAQKAVFAFVNSGCGHGIINAVAGAGKTTTLIGCVDHLPEGVEENCLFCAFNKSIETEIHNRFVSSGHNLITVKTIHALGYQILKENLTNDVQPPQENKYKTILEEPEFINHISPILNKILRLHKYLTIVELRDLEAIDRSELTWKEKNEINEGWRHLRDVKARLLNICNKYRLSIDKRSYMTDEEFKSMLEHYGIFEKYEMQAKTFEQEFKLYKRANERLLAEGNSMIESHGILDFIDMLYFPNQRNYMPNEMYDFIFVDECQDLSKAQLMIVARYLRKDGRLLAVGDPYQSIYGFAGADAESYNRIKRVFKAQELKLTKCFRCPQNVISLAKEVRIDIEGFKQERGVTETISETDVLSYIKAGDLVISRRKSPLMELAFNLIEKKKEVRVHPDEVDEIINDLKSPFKIEERTRYLNDKEYDALKKKVLKREVQRYIKEVDSNPDEAIKKVLIQNFEDDLNTKLDLISQKRVEWGENNIDEIVRKYRALIVSNSKSAIKLSTIHRAKGLENDRVFILNYDQLPEIRPNQKDWEKEQEWNLKYVAITRAKQELYMVRSNKKHKVGVADKGIFDTLDWN